MNTISIIVETNTFHLKIQTLTLACTNKKESIRGYRAVEQINDWT